MAANFELLFEHGEGDIYFSLMRHGITQSRNKASWVQLEPKLRVATEAVEKAELDQLEDESLLQAWSEIIGQLIGESTCKVIFAAAPANLIIAIDSTIPENYYDLFRSAPWEQAIFKLGKHKLPAESQSLLEDNQITVIDVRITRAEQATATSVAGVEQVPASQDFYSDKPDHDADGTYFPVWFGTNRHLIDGPEGVSEIEGQISDDKIHVGQCEVWIPKSHRRGELKSPWYRPEAILKSDYLKLEDVSLLDAIGPSILEAIAQSSATNHLLFIHGFNSSFREAILRAAQIGFDLGINGATMAFCWPSRKLFPFVSRYVGDGQVISGSEKALLKMTEQFSGLEGKIHVIAHSMGNRPLTRAWRKMLQTISDSPKLEVGQVVFAAPDVYQAAFKDDTEGIFEFCERATMYANRRDYALGISRFLTQTDRAGLIPPVMSLEQIDTIEVPFNMALFGHTYFAKLVPLLEDLAGLIEHNEAPGTGSRSQLVPQSESPPGHWVFP